MPSCAVTNNSYPEKLQADEPLIAEEKEIPSKLIESLNNAHSQGRVWLGCGYQNPRGDVLKDGSDSQVAEHPSLLFLAQPGHNHTVSELLRFLLVGTLRAGLHLSDLFALVSKAASLARVDCQVYACDKESLVKRTRRQEK